MWLEPEPEYRSAGHHLHRHIATTYTRLLAALRLGKKRTYSFLYNIHPRVAEL